MNRTDLAALLLFVPLLYASALAFEGFRAFDATVLAGALLALLPLVGFVAPELRLIGWVPGAFLLVLLFVVDGVTANPLPGPLAGLAAGAAAASPVLVGLAVVEARDRPGVRAFLAIVALLAAEVAAVLAGSAPYGSPSAFATAFALFPHRQAVALSQILVGATPATLPFDAAVPSLFPLLVLLGGAGVLAGFLSIGDRPVEALGYDRAEAPVPEGTYRSLLPEGREPLAESTPSVAPTAPELPSIASVLAAVVAALVVLAIATIRPNALLGTISGVAFVGVALVAFVSVRSRSEESGPARAAAPVAPAPSVGTLAADAPARV